MSINKRVWTAASVAIAAAIIYPVTVGFQQRTPAAKAGVTDRVVEAGNAFLITLSADERSKVTFPFNSSQRTGWSNLPSPMFQRNGLRLGDLTTARRDAAMRLVAAALSSEGYRKVNEIMNGD